MPNRSFYSSTKSFAASSPDALNAAIEVINAQESWEDAHVAETAADISPSIGLPTPVLQTWFKRQKYGVVKMTPAIFADQQKIADAFFKLGVIPTKIDVTQAAWTA
jgi:sulfonate transport system substrate-binding protein